MPLEDIKWMRFCFCSANMSSRTMSRTYHRKREQRFTKCRNLFTWSSNPSIFFDFTTLWNLAIDVSTRWCLICHLQVPSGSGRCLFVLLGCLTMQVGFWNLYALDDIFLSTISIENNRNNDLLHYIHLSHVLVFTLVSIFFRVLVGQVRSPNKSDGILFMCCSRTALCFTFDIESLHGLIDGS